VYYFTFIYITTINHVELSLQVIIVNRVVFINVQKIKNFFPSLANSSFYEFKENSIVTLINFSYNLLPNIVYFPFFFYNRYLLDKLELYDRKEKTVVEECTIEHIIPQNDDLSINWQKELGENWKEIHEKFRHTLGNLTLTGYNSELGDRPFIEKRDMNAIHLSQDIRDLDHWNEEEIIKRSKKLSKLALEIWLMEYVVKNLICAQIILEKWTIQNMKNSIVYIQFLIGPH